jgi:hypothetical protein
MFKMKGILVGGAKRSKAKPKERGLRMSPRLPYSRMFKFLVVQMEQGRGK